MNRGQYEEGRGKSARRNGRVKRGRTGEERSEDKRIEAQLSGKREITRQRERG